MRIVIVGCSGSVGQELVPELLARGCNLTLLGRDPVKLKNLFPNCDCQSIEKPTGIHKADRLVNLAARNNDAPGTLDQFLAVNRDFALKALSLAVVHGIRSYVYVSSVHALEPDRDDPYSISKVLGEEALLREAQSLPLAIEILYLGAFVSTAPRGKLRMLRHVPDAIRRPVLAAIGAIRPITLPSELATVISKKQESQPLRLRHVCVDRQDSNPFYNATVRSFEIVSALFGLALSAPLVFTLGILIRADSRGPALFAQKRVGRGGRTFTCYKLRTMRGDTATAPTHQISSSSVTRLGEFLRRTKLDELPQLWNVLCGDMSLVGPRPGLPIQRELFSAREARNVFSVRPGITGLAQINGVDMSDPERLAQLDRIYIDIRSIALDIKILKRTLLGAGRGDQVTN